LENFEEETLDHWGLTEHYYTRRRVDDESKEDLKESGPRPALIVFGGCWTHAKKSPGESWADILAKKYNFQLRKITYYHTSNQQLIHRLNKFLIRSVPKLKKRGIKIAGLIFEIQNTNNISIENHDHQTVLRLGMDEWEKKEIKERFKLDVDQYYNDVHAPGGELIYDRMKYQVAVVDRLLKAEGIPNYWWDALDEYIFPGSRILVNSMLTELTWNEAFSPDSIQGHGKRAMTYKGSERVKFAVDTGLLHRNLEPTIKSHKRIAMVMEYSMKDIFNTPYYYMSIRHMRGSLYKSE